MTLIELLAVIKFAAVSICVANEEKFMARIVRFHHIGGPEVLTLNEVEIPSPVQVRSAFARARSD